MNCQRHSFGPLTILPYDCIHSSALQTSLCSLVSGNTWPVMRALPFPWTLMMTETNRPSFQLILLSPGWFLLRSLREAFSSTVPGIKCFSRSCPQCNKVIQFYARFSPHFRFILLVGPPLVHSHKTARPNSHQTLTSPQPFLCKSR